MVFYILWFLGLSITLYLIYINYFSDTCPIGMKCTEFPPILGFIWFLVTPITIKRDFTRMVWQISGLAGIIILVSIEFMSNFFCPLCTVAQFTGLAMIVLSLKFANLLK
jgi:uncharacterized membrane protein